MQEIKFQLSDLNAFIYLSLKDKMNLFIKNRFLIYSHKAFFEM